jgi:elongation factor Ts
MISASQVKELRDATGISMLKCKQALEKAQGDQEKARDILRKAGEADAAKRSEKEVCEGTIAIKIENNKGAILQLFCETDFVAKADSFLSLADELIVDAINGKDIKSESEAKLQEGIQKNGENIKLGEVQIVEGEKVVSYIHSNKKIGVLVSFTGEDEEIGKDVAMQIAAMNPAVLSPEDVNEEDVAKESEIQKDILTKEGKPAEIFEKIMTGKLRKFRESKSLLKQAFVKDSSKTVEQFLADNKAKIVSFVRLAI